ncbi:MAG: ParB/RepB/Spo0J family partition protein [bacterium]|nr:ParB/RepB/Spo0J family partition protein [bacterium]
MEIPETEKKHDNSIYWIDVDKIDPNPYQPRREFDEARLKDLSESILMYGVLQPIVVSRIEKEKEDGGIAVQYELIAGERRTRASKLAGLRQIPAIIRTGPSDDRAKLELAIIENLQREDLNCVECARAFKRLMEEFKFTHAQIGKKVGKSREYVANRVRILNLPEEILLALKDRKISEGHTRPLLMVGDLPQEQMTFFKEILYKNLTVREAENISRRIAHGKMRRKHGTLNPEIIKIEDQLTEHFGTRVQIEVRNKARGGGRMFVDFFSSEDLRRLISTLGAQGLDREVLDTVLQTVSRTLPEKIVDDAPQDEEDADLYSVSSFTI